MAQETEYSFPVFDTQGGGLVREVGEGTFIFVEKPSCPGFEVGDIMPEEWGLAPGNDKAHDLYD